MNIIDFLADFGSTTKTFKTWSDEYSLDVIENGIMGDVFCRLVVIFVDKMPVMLGLSETRLSNPKFLDILKNAGSTPIGVRLFAANSGISRIEPFIGQLDTEAVTIRAIKDSLVQYGASGMIYYRQSNFVIDNEIMTLQELVLPGLNDVLRKYT